MNTHINTTALPDVKFEGEVKLPVASVDSAMGEGLEVTSFEGAMKALRHAQKKAADFDGGSVGPLMNGAMAFFDNLGARTGGALAFAVEMVEGLDLSGVSDTGWLAVYDGLTLAAHGIEGIMQRPQCQDRDELNAAGLYLQAISDFLFNERRRAMETLFRRPFNPVEDPYMESMMTLQWLAYESNGEQFDELENFVATARDRHKAHEEYRTGKVVRA